MFYCPKCQQTYNEGTQRFCSNDGVRLLPAPSSGKSVNQTKGVFTNLLGRTAIINNKDEQISSSPKFVKVKSFTEDEPISRPDNDQFFKVKAENNFASESNHFEQKPLPRIIKQDGIPPSQAKLGDRKINLTLENADVLIGKTVKSRYKIVKIVEADEAVITYSAVDNLVPDKKVIVQIF